MTKLFYCDTETTGTNPQIHGIHQLSFIIEYVNNDGSREIKEKVNLKIKPNATLTIDQSALDVSGVTLEMLDTYSDEETSFRHLKNILKKYVNSFNKQDKMFFVGYNVGFDVQFVREFFLRNGDNYFGSLFWSNPIDVMTLAGMRLMNTRHEMANFQLMTVASQMGFDVNTEEAHDAMYDIETTREMFLMLCPTNSREIQTIDVSKKSINAASKLLKETKLDSINAVTGTKSLSKIDSEDFIFGFGKHSGMSISEILKVNPGYIIWAHDNCVKGYQFSAEILDKAIKANTSAKKNYSSFYTPHNGSDDFFDQQFDDNPF